MADKVLGEGKHSDLDVGHSTSDSLPAKASPEPTRLPRLSLASEHRATEELSKGATLSFSFAPSEEAVSSAVSAVEQQKQTAEVPNVAFDLP